MAIQYKKIMVTLDGSALANEALPHAELLAKSLNAELVIFRVAQDITAGAALTRTDQAQVELVDEAERMLRDLPESMAHRGIRAKVEIDVGDAAHRIVTYAKDHNVDMIMMSTHGRTGLARMVYGSVAEKVLHTAPCSVLLIRSQIKPNDL